MRTLGVQASPRLRSTVIGGHTKGALDESMALPPPSGLQPNRTWQILRPGSREPLPLTVLGAANHGYCSTDVLLIPLLH